MQAHAVITSRTVPDRSAATLEVNLLGRFEVVRRGLPIPARAWRRRRPADLLTLVALSRGALSREQAMATLWPDKDPVSAASNLHRALYDLRQLLGGRWVNLDQDAVRLDPQVWIDAEAFEAATASGDPSQIEAALPLYRGELAPDDRDAPWLTERRAELRALFVQAALPAAHAAIERGDTGKALALLQRIVHSDATQEGAHRLLMQLLAARGLRADALRQYDHCEAALRASQLRGPGPETRALRDSIRSGPQAPGPADAPYDGLRRAALRLLGIADPPPVRGRTAGLVLFQSLVEHGSGVLVLLGERGVGKTRLAVEGARIAQERGAVILAGIPEGGGPCPSNPFADALDDFRRWAPPSLGDPFAARPGDQSLWADAGHPPLHERVLRALCAAGGGRPVFLLLDEIDRADEPSLSLLHALARSARGHRLMLVACCREDEVRSGTPIQMALSHLDCERLARGVRVQRLDLEATRQQIGDLLGSPPSDAVLSQVHRLTGGSPFYTEELTRAMQETGQLTPVSDPEAAVRARVARLGPEVEALLTAAAVAGRRFDLEVVRPASGLAAPEALRALDICLERRLLEEDGSGYHFHHSLVREELYRALAPERRTELHRALADALEAQADASLGGSESVAEALAHHRSAGQQPARAFPHLVAAGQRAAARMSLHVALDHLGHALALVEGRQLEVAPVERFHLVESVAQIQLAIGDLPGVARAFEAATTGPTPAATTPAQRARALEWAALGLAASGDGASAEAKLRAGLEALASEHGDAQAELLSLLAELRWHARDFSGALALAQRALQEAGPAGDAETAAIAGQILVLSQAAMGLAPIAEAPCPRPSARPFPVHLTLWMAALIGDRSGDELESAVAAFGMVAQASGPCRALSLSMEGALRLRAAQWDLAEVALRDAVAMQRASGSALAEAFTLERLGMLLTTRGRVEEGMSVLAEGVTAAERGVLRLHGLTRLHASLARNRLVAGAIYAADDCIREASESSARHGPCVVCDAHFRPEAVRVALARGRIGDAETEATQLEAIAAQHGGQALSAIARTARARVQIAQGRPLEAHAGLERARQIFLAVGDVLEAARCLAVDAAALRSAGPDWQAEADDEGTAAARVLGPTGPAAELR
jgi:DNA-binding SARP family transcriptional activator